MFISTCTSRTDKTKYKIIVKVSQKNIKFSEVQYAKGVISFHKTIFKTGDTGGAGTDADVQIQLTGSKGYA